MTVIENQATVDLAEDSEARAARRRKAESVLIPIATVIGLILFWQFGVRLFAVPSYIAPAPSEVAATFVEKFPILWSNFIPTFYESVLGFIAGNLAAVLHGYESRLTDFGIRRDAR